MSILGKQLKAIANHEPLSQALAEDAFGALMEGKCEDLETAAFLMGLRARGETAVEITAGAHALRSRATRVAAPDGVIDTCGTGGDAKGTYNISTAAAIVAAGAGARVAKHGNRAISSKSGSSDVLAALGVNIEADADTVSRCIETAGVGFLFAPSHHSAVRHVAKARAALGVRTIFNVLGPLANPAGAKRQLIGVFEERLCGVMASALAQLGAERAWVVHGRDGLDELTTTGETLVASLENGRVTELVVRVEDLELPRARPNDLLGAGPTENALAIKELVGGARGPFRDIVALNAGAALLIANKARSLFEGVRAAIGALDDGSAAKALDTLVKVSNGQDPA